jgi:transcriptional regulator with XRE-family HTH domain
MATKKNILKELREKNGCKLSAGQIALRMGLSGTTIISKFENGTTKNWDILNFFRYCHVTNLDPREVFSTRYPEEAYSRKYNKILKDTVRSGNEESIESGYTAFGLTDSTETGIKIPAATEMDLQEDLEKLKAYILTKKYRNENFHTQENTCIVSKPAYGLSRHFILPEIITSMMQGKNVFAVMENHGDEIDSLIREYAKESGHEVYISRFSETEELDWFMSIREPEAVNLFAKTVAAMKKERKECPKDIFEDILKRLLKAYLWNSDIWNCEEKRNTEAFRSWINTLSEQEKVQITGNKYSKEMIKEILSDIDIIFRTALRADPAAQKETLASAFQKKHVIIYTKSWERCGISVPSLVLMQYMRILNNMKEHSEMHRDTREYTVIVSGIEDTKIPISVFWKWIKKDRSMGIRFYFSVTSLERLERKMGKKGIRLVSQIPVVHVQKQDFESGKYLEKRLGSATASSGNIKTFFCLKKGKRPRSYHVKREKDE